MSEDNMNLKKELCNEITSGSLTKKRLGKRIDSLECNVNTLKNHVNTLTNRVAERTQRFTTSMFKERTSHQSKRAKLSLHLQDAKQGKDAAVDEMKRMKEAMANQKDLVDDAVASEKLKGNERLQKYGQKCMK